MSRLILSLAALTLASCAALPVPPALQSCQPTIKVTTDSGTTPFTIALYQTEQPQAVGYFYKQVLMGNYVGNFITRAVPGYFVTFGEKSWQNQKNAGSITLTEPREDLRQKRSHSGELALIKNPDGSHGPFLLVRTGTAGQGADYLPDALPIGRVKENFASAKALTKGDRVSVLTLSHACQPK